jgi:hypothetical protein
MNHIHTEPGAPLVRASDAERDQAAGLLRAAFAEGRLTRAELDERLAVAYAAKARADLSDLTGDLPGAVTAEVMAAGRPLAADLPAVNRGTGEPGPACTSTCACCCACCSCFRRPGWPTGSTGS